MSVSSKQPFSFDLSGRVAPRPAPEAPETASPADCGLRPDPSRPAKEAAGHRRVCMRLPCDLYGEVKALAGREGKTVTDVVAEALRMRLARPDLFKTVGESRLT